MLQKKVTILVVLLAALGAAAFAQVSISGTVEYDLNTVITSVKDGDTNATADSDVLENSNVIVSYVKDAISGRVIIRTAPAAVGTSGNLFDATANWKVNDLFSLGVGYSWLPGTFFGVLGIDGDVNAFLGSSAIGRQSFLRLNIDGAYVGFWLPEAKTPGFFAGYDYRASNFSAGLNFTGAYRTVEEILGIVASIHGTVTFGSATVKLNVALHKDGDEDKPAVYALGGDLIRFPAGVGSDINHNAFLEGLLGFDYNLGKATAALTVAYGHNTDSGANTLRAGLALPIQVVGGFRVIPGLIFKSTLADHTGIDNEVSSDKSTTELKLGVSLAYSY
jgi:hypothetical protein